MSSATTELRGIAEWLQTISPENQSPLQGVFSNIETLGRKAAQDCEPREAAEAALRDALDELRELRLAQKESRLGRDCDDLDRLLARMAGNRVLRVFYQAHA